MGRRDLVMNIVLGSVILITASLMFTLFVASVWVGLSVLKYLADLFFPSVVLPEPLTLYAIYGITAVVPGVGHLRRGLWRNAFLCLAILPVLAFAWLANPSPPFGLDSFPALWLLYMMLFIPQKSLVPRTEFFVAALLVVAVVILSSGLAGSGSAARIVSHCTELAAIILLGIQVRRSQAAVKVEQPGSPIVA